MKLNYFSVSGNYYDVGYLLGQKYGSKARILLNNTKKVAHDQKIPYKEIISIAKKCEPHCIKHYPNYIQELKGFAEGSKISFDDLLALICADIVRSFYDKKDFWYGCTSIGITTDEGAFLAHNEDLHPAWEKSLTLVKYKINGKKPYFALSYAGFWPFASLSKVLALGGTLLHQKRVRIGVPDAFRQRAIMEAKSTKRALHEAKAEDRGFAYNSLIVTKNQIYDVEPSTREYVITKDKFHVHTNNYLSPKMKKFEGHPSINWCQWKYDRVLNLIEEYKIPYKKTDGILPKAITEKALKKILSDHELKPDSICAHICMKSPYYDRGKTVCSIVANVTKGILKVNMGNPCRGEWKSYYLKD